MTKNYLLKVLENCSEEKFGQDAVEWAVITGRIRLTGDLQTDLRNIFKPITPPLSNCCDAPPKSGLSLKCQGFCGTCGNDAVFKAETRYDEVCAGWRLVCNDLERASMESMTQSGILEEILRPVPLSQTI